MTKSLAGKKLGIIHAALITTRAVQKYIDEFLPGVEVVHWLDDTIQNTNFACAPVNFGSEEIPGLLEGSAALCHYPNVADWPPSVNRHGAGPDSPAGSRAKATGYGSPADPFGDIRTGVKECHVGSPGSHARQARSDHGACE